MYRARVVIDTSVFVSRLLLPASIPAQAVRQAVEEAQILMSEEVLRELAEVLSRPKFNPYVTVQERQHFLGLLTRIVEMVPIIHTVNECRDPKDNKILELALSGEADFILTGDRDLLTLNPFRNINIITPVDYLADTS